MRKKQGHGLEFICFIVFNYCKALRPSDIRSLRNKVLLLLVVVVVVVVSDAVFFTVITRAQAAGRPS